MATETYQVQLERVQAEIARIEGKGQNYTVRDRSMNRARLDTLYKREKELRALAAREARGGGARVRGGTPL